MKLRHFSIRDLLWLTALCAVLVAWWIDHRQTAYDKRKSEVNQMVSHGNAKQLDVVWDKYRGLEAEYGRLLQKYKAQAR